MTRLLLILTLSLSASILYGQDEILGKWKTIDDDTGKAKAIVEIYKDGNKYAGKVIKTFPRPDGDPDPICDKCPDEYKDQKIIGLEIMKNLEYDDGEWEDGTILDAVSGKVYDCKLWIDEEKLKVRGYIAFFYRTQTWERYER